MRRRLLTAASGSILLACAAYTNRATRRRGRAAFGKGALQPRAPALSRSGDQAMMSKFFIEHPVLANVLAIVLVLIGAICVFRLPVAQYPNVVPPTVQVTTRYPGASAQTVIDTVALPIELQVNGAPGMIYMQSTSAYDGTYVLTVTFNIGSDSNSDQVLVQNRVNNALASLPTAVQSQGVAIRAKSPSILEFV